MNQMKISLSVITGNCEADVGRFLDTFQPYFDEVVMVRAVGSQTPDNTLRLAKARFCKVAEYENKERRHAIEHDWPHVDNFAAARNLAASLCTGDWIMWADMDDTAEGLEKMRELLAKIPDDVAMIQCPYVVSSQGVVCNYRERLWKNNGNFEWKNAIHENLIPKIDGMGVVKTDDFRIIHMPRGDRECTLERNMRILESVPEEDRTHGHTFYLMTEYARRGDARAVETAKAFLNHPESATPERYETYMTLAAMAEEPETKAVIYCQAWMEDPSRAEALYELTAISMFAGQYKRALDYARQMMTCPWPANPTWNHRRLFYGFFREDLYLQCLRMNGRQLESDTRRDNILSQSGKTTISLIHATRGRPDQAMRCRSEWLRMADHPERVEHIFGVDLNDPFAVEFLRFPTAFVNGAGGPVEAWNAAARESKGGALLECHHLDKKGNILVQLSDDWKPFKGWDTAIADAIGDATKPAVLAVSDGHRKDDLLCMAIMTRARYEDQEFMFHPEFFSMFSDNWFSHCAFRDCVVIDARDRIKFEHLHPAFGKAEMDETYARSNDNFHYITGQAIMRRLMDGTRIAAEVQGWCDYRDFYAYVAKTIPDGARIAEVGSWMGQSIIYLCQRLQDLGKHNVEVHCVDTWKGEENQPLHEQVVNAHGGSIYARFVENIEAAGVSDMIKTTIGDSAESAADFEDASMDFVFIDAAHDYDSVVKDLAAWWPKMKPDGIFAGHDYPHWEVAKAVDEHAKANGYTVGTVGRCWIKTNDQAR